MIITASGIRYLKYMPCTGTNYMEANDKYIVIYAGNGLTDGAWHYIERNMSDDLHSVESGNTLLDVDGIAIRNASMYLDGLRFSNQETKTVYSLQSGAIGFILSSRDAATGNDTWYHYDRLGTVMNLTDDVGAITATYDQDAFGNVLNGNSAGFHLITKDYNSDIGLYYFYQRWYDPEIGRFIKKDPLLNTSQINKYDFCFSSPVNYIDPTGESAVVAFGLLLNALRACGLAGYQAYLYADCIDHCKDGWKKIMSNPNIPHEVKCQFNPHGDDPCPECLDLIPPLRVAAIDCILSASTLYIAKSLFAKPVFKSTISIICCD